MRWLRGIRRTLAWLIIARYEPRHEAPELGRGAELLELLPAPRTEPIAFYEPEHERLAAGYELGSLRVWEPEPEDARYDYALSWGRAWRDHERGDVNAIQDWLEAGWIADPWWIRCDTARLAVAA